MASQFDLVWEGEKSGVPAAVAKKVTELRSTVQEQRIKVLRIMMQNPKNIEIALAIISDDASKLPLVQHVPTDLLYSLGSVNMIRARHKQAEMLGKESKEEAEAIQVVVDRQMSELRSQLDHSIKTQQYLQTKLDGLTSAVADIGLKATDHYKETNGALQSITATLAKVLAQIGSWVPGLSKVKDIAAAVHYDLRGFMRHTGVQPPSEAISQHRFVGP